MIVHADDAGHHRIAFQIQDRGVSPGLFIFSGGDGGDLSVVDVQVLVRNRGRSRSIDDLHMFENDLARAHAHVLADRWRERIDSLCA